MTAFKYLFGPVPSRRFGRSLGVDLLTPKTCTLNCAFCEVGPTTRQTLERREYAPTAAVLRELEDWYALGIPVDFVTVAGSGEPTLHIRFGDILAAIRAKKMFRSALLTNSTLFFLPEVRQQAGQADVVKATLSAWDQTSFAKVTRPHPALRFDAIVDGLRTFRRDYPGEIWLEVFVIPGVNDRIEDQRAIAALAATFKPDRIHLNTAVRPTAEIGVAAAAAGQLETLAQVFTPRAEVIARFKSAHRVTAPAPVARIQDLLRRRPCTANDVSHAFALDPPATRALLDDLERRGLVTAEHRDGEVYYLTRAGPATQSNRRISPARSRCAPGAAGGNTE